MPPDLALPLSEHLKSHMQGDPSCQKVKITFLKKCKSLFFDMMCPPLIVDEAVHRIRVGWLKRRCASRVLECCVMNEYY